MINYLSGLSFVKLHGCDIKSLENVWLVEEPINSRVRIQIIFLHFPNLLQRDQRHLKVHNGEIFALKGLVKNQVINRKIH